MPRGQQTSKYLRSLTRPESVCIFSIRRGTRSLARAASQSVKEMRLVAVVRGHACPTRRKGVSGLVTGLDAHRTAREEQCERCASQPAIATRRTTGAGQVAASDHVARRMLLLPLSQLPTQRRLLRARGGQATEAGAAEAGARDLPRRVRAVRKGRALSRPELGHCACGTHDAAPAAAGEARRR